MKFIARHLNLIGLLLLTAFGAAAAGLYFQAPERAPAAPPKLAPPVAHLVCPMHPKVTSVSQTDCPKCGMKLVAFSSESPEANEPHHSGCCAEKPVAAEPPAAMARPHLAAQAAQASACCPKPANP